jgi:hypothetical protein
VNRPRPPVVVGLTGDAGAGTLAAALHARDGGRIRGSAAAADVLVCRSAEAPLRHAAALALPASGPRPVLAVTRDAATRVTGPVAAWLRALEPRFGAVVELPHVVRWHGAADAGGEAALVLAHSVEHLPRPLRAYAVALRLLVTAVAGSGLLDRPAPPVVSGPRTVELWRGLGSVERAVPLRPVLLAAPEPRVPVRPRAIAPGLRITERAG